MIYQTVKIFNIVKNAAAYQLKHSVFWRLAFTILQFLQKLSSLIYFHYSFLKAWFSGITYQNFLKDLYKNEASKHFIK